MEKAELIITAMQQRMGEMISNYELQIAVLRAEITQMIQEKEEKTQAAEEYSKNLEEKTSKQKPL